MAEPVTFDIETTGLDPFLPGFEIIMLGLKVGDGPSLLCVGEAIPHAARWLEQQPKTVAWNAGFDALALRCKYGVRLRPHDPMFFAYLLDENERHDLKSVAMRRLGVPPWEHGMRANLAAGKETEEDALAQYCGRDLLYTKMLYDLLREEILGQPELARVYRRILGPALWMFLDAQFRGVYIDRAQILRAARESTRQVRKARAEIVACGLAHNLVVNPNAPHQLAKLLYGTLKIPVPQYTDKGQPSTDKLSLKKIRGKHDVVESILDYREWNKRLTTYVRPYWDLSKAYEGSRIHPTTHLTFTTTGRTSSSDPNIQQVPRVPLLRSFVAAPPGKKLVIADYSQAEVRVLADEAQEKAMLEAYREGRDLYVELAKEVMGSEYNPNDKEQRLHAKVATLGFLYGAEETTFINSSLKNYDLVVSEKEATRARAAFFRKWPGLDPWYRHIYGRVSSSGMVASRTGRLRRLPDIHSSRTYVREEALRQAINFPIQSFASDLLLLAAIEIDAWLPERLIACVHDSVILEVEERHTYHVCELVKVSMEERVPEILKEQFDISLTVPLVAEVTVAQAWG